MFLLALHPPEMHRDSVFEIRNPQHDLLSTPKPKDSIAMALVAQTAIDSYGEF